MDIDIQLYEYASKGNIEGVQSALKQGGNPHYYYRKEDQKNSLHVAVENGYYEICKLLIEKGGVNVDSIASTPQATPLIYSVQNNHLPITELLINAGANINISNGYGNSALHTCCRKGFFDISCLLISHGADCTLKNHKGSTALHFCGFANTNAKDCELIAKKLIEAGAKLDEIDSRGNTPLMTACLGGHLELMKVLIDLGAAKDVKNYGGESLSDIAVFYNHDNIIQANVV